MEQTEGIAQAVEDAVLVVVATVVAAVSGIDHIDSNDSKTLLKLFMKALAFHLLTQKVFVYCIIAYIRLSLQACSNLQLLLSLAFTQALFASMLALPLQPNWNCEPERVNIPYILIRDRNDPGALPALKC